MTLHSRPSVPPSRVCGSEARSSAAAAVAAGLALGGALG